MEVVHKYFKNTDSQTIEKLLLFKKLFTEWNSKINLVSRKDIDNLEIHHILHSLSIAKYIQFKPGASIMDLGTGGGFPGLPLSIFYPEVQFILIDSIQKKINAVNEMIQALELKNVVGICGRAEQSKENYDFVITRAVAKLDHLKSWSMKKLKVKSIHAIPNGLIALKGPAGIQEMKVLGKKDFAEATKISSWFDEVFFDEKYIIYVQG